jgi:Bacterial SH3 domain
MYWMHRLTAATLVAISAAIAQAQPAPPPPSEPTPPPAAAPAAPPQADLASGTVNANVNLRRGPGTNYTVITLIPAGAGVAVGECNGGWCQVAYQGQDGYVIATSLGQGGPSAPRSAAAGYPPGYGPDYPQPVDVAPPPYYGPYYYYGYRPYYYGYGPYYYGYRGYWRRHW